MNKKPSFTIVHHQARQSLGLTVMQYCVADMVSKLSNKPKYEWCQVSKRKMADWLGATKPGVIKMINTLEEMGLVERNEKGKLRTTQKRYDVTELEDDKSKPSLPEGSTEFTPKGKLSLPPSNKNNNKNKKTTKKKKKGLVVVTEEEAIKRMKENHQGPFECDSQAHQQTLIYFFRCGYKYKKDETLTDVNDRLKELAKEAIGFGQDQSIPRNKFFSGLKTYHQRMVDNPGKVKHVKTSVRNAFITKGWVLGR